MKFYMDTKYMTDKGESAATEQVQGAGDLSPPHTPSIYSSQCRPRHTDRVGAGGEEKGEAAW